MQPELFPNPQQAQRPRRFSPQLFPSRYLRMRVAYEDLLFWILSLLLILLAGFCLGVERGKRLDAPGMGSASSVQMAASRDLPVLAARPMVQGEARRAVVVEENVEPPGEYVIQLASYLDLQAAKKEAGRLRGLGVSTEVVRQGRYLVLRAKGYRTRSQALSTLASLKATYRDGFIKKI